MIKNILPDHPWIRAELISVSSKGEILVHGDPSYSLCCILI